MKTLNILAAIFLLIIFLATSVGAVYVDGESLSDKGNVIRIQGINTNPSFIAPGKEGDLNIKIKNNANYYIDDVRIKLSLPSNIYLSNDVSDIKISKLNAGESKEVKYKIIVSPTSSEGVYSGVLNVNYISHFGASYLNIGEERFDNFTFGIIVKSSPEFFANVDSTELYKGNNIGKVTIKFVNNDVANIKFLTVELKESDDYEILSNNQQYIGDLDSDDYESVDFKIKLKNEDDKIMLPLELVYKDSLNNNYSEKREVELDIRSAKELGVKTNGILQSIIIFLFFLIIGYYSYRKYKKKKKREEKKF